VWKCVDDCDRNHNKAKRAFFKRKVSNTVTTFFVVKPDGALIKNGEYEKK